MKNLFIFVEKNRIFCQYSLQCIKECFRIIRVHKITIAIVVNKLDKLKPILGTFM